MEPTFKIVTTNSQQGSQKLFIEINLWGVTYLVIDDANNCTAVISYHFPADTTYERAAVYIKQSVLAQPLLQETFTKITIIYAYPVAMLVPHSFFDGVDNKKMLELVYGDVTDAYIRSDFSYKNQLHTIYSIPKPVDAVVSYIFKADVTMHQYGLLCEVMPFTGNHLYCIFGNSHFTVQLFKEGRLQAMQSFQFKAPEDVSYYLLQLCTCYSVPAAEVQVQLNGMIDEGSVLYNEVAKYFLQLELQSLPATIIYPEELSHLPAHYFSHLFQMVLCV